mgnify:FL=1|jgi:hypothetical protein
MRAWESLLGFGGRVATLRLTPAFSLLSMHLNPSVWPLPTRPGAITPLRLHLLPPCLCSLPWG